MRKVQMNSSSCAGIILDFCWIGKKDCLVGHTRVDNWCAAGECKRVVHEFETPGLELPVARVDRSMSRKSLYSEP